ncbi:MAG: flagellar hook-length control protein FliK [Desulfovibrionaceae bacterium]|nr:flagellar hook-length control protein FliK [Desulfovibrionaceae bacterium]
MQIQPVMNNQNVFMPEISSQRSDFADYLDNEENLLENVDEEKSKDIESPYSRHTTNGYTYTLDEVCFTKEELSELYNSLLKNNAQAKDLEKLKSLAELPGGATLGQVMLAMKGQNKDVQVSDEDANNITSLTESIDPSGMLSNAVLNALYANDPIKAVRSIHEALDDLSAGDTLTVSKNDLLALGRAMGLSDTALNKIEDFFNGEESGTVTAEGAKKLLLHAEEELLSAKSKRQTLEKALGSSLTALLNKARSRMEQEAAAANEKTRKAAHSEVMIARTVQKETRQTLNTILDAMHKDADKNDLASQSIEDLQHFGISELDIMRMKDTHLGEKREQHPEHGQEKGHKEFASMFRAHDMRPAPQPIAATPAFFAAQAGTEPIAMQRPNMNQTLPTHLANQVESGILTTMGNGATRLALQLHPQELGNLAIILVANNGEVSAHIRADKAETVEMLNRQAEAIRISLEEQGIKIDNIEIELNDNRQDHADQQFLQDMEQRHTFQEENARRDQLRRLRNLAAAGEGVSTHMERNMQEVGKEEETQTKNRILDRVA